MLRFQTRLSGGFAIPRRTVEKIDLDWLAEVTTITLTAGDNAPQDIVEQTLDFRKDRFDPAVDHRACEDEHARFPLPRELRQ